MSADVTGSPSCPLILGRSFQVGSMVPSALIFQMLWVVEGSASASSGNFCRFSSTFWSLLAGKLWAWMAPPEVEALADRLITKPFGSRSSAMRRVFGARVVVPTDDAELPGAAPFAAGAPPPELLGVQAPIRSTKLT